MVGISQNCRSRRCHRPGAQTPDPRSQTLDWPRRQRPSGCLSLLGLNPTERPSTPSPTPLPPPSLFPGGAFVTRPQGGLWGRPVGRVLAAHVAERELGEATHFHSDTSRPARRSALWEEL